LDEAKTEKKKCKKVVWLVLEDPLSYAHEDVPLNEIPLMEPIKLEMAGLVIHEDDEKIVLGEIVPLKGNEIMANYLSENLPLVHSLILVLKKNIISRKDFILKDDD